MNEQFMKGLETQRTITVNVSDVLMKPATYMQVRIPIERLGNGEFRYQVVEIKVSDDLEVQVCSSEPLTVKSFDEAYS